GLENPPSRASACTGEQAGANRPRPTDGPALLAAVENGFSRTFGESGPAVGGTPGGELSFVLAVRDVFSATSCSSGAGAGLHGPWCAWDHDPPACEAKARSVPRLRRADGPDS